MARAGFLRLPGRGGRHAAWLIIGFSVLCTCAILANLAYQVLRGRADAVAHASGNTAVMARVLEAHTIASVDATELALLATENALRMLAPGDPQRGARIDRLLAESIDRLPFIRAIWVLDAQGNMIHDSQHLPGSYNLSDRAYFKIHRDQPKPGLYIDLPIVSKHGVPFIGLSRRIDRPDGSFGGVVVAALEPDYLRRFYQSIRSGRDGAVALVRRDGPLLLRVPELPINPNSPHPAGRFMIESEKALEGSYRDTSAFDGIERLYFFRHVARRPLLVVVGIGADEMLAGWRRTSLAYGAVSLAFLLLVVGLARFALRELANRQRMNGALADSERALRAAQRLSNMGSWSLDRATRQARWSEEMYRIFGLEPAAQAPSLDAFLELIHPDDREPLRQAGASVTPWSGPVRTNPAHGPLRYLQARASQVETGLMGTLQDVTEQRRADEDIRHATAQLQFMHSHDPLTGLPNRSLLGDRLLQAIEAARPQQRRLAVLLLNVDRLKRVNEGIGHDAGDLLLAEVGTRLSGRLQPGDTLARLGSDEFVMLLGSPGDSGDINACARQLLDAVAQPFDLHGHELTVTASIGIALYPEDGATPGELLKNADSALTHAKQAGRNSFRYFTAQMNVRALHWMSLEHRLRGALGRGELLLHYQPQMALAEGRLCGAEALIRWRNGDAGLVSPADFIPLAEDTGLILPIGEWVIRSACRQARAWQDAGLAPLRIAVNVSAHQISAGTVPEVVRAALEESALAPQWLTVELTESVLMKEAGLAAHQIAQLRAMGIEVALDDFGTGYSSLAYLSRFALDKIKIDQSLVRHVTDDAKSAAIAGATIALAHGLGLAVVAEGVETQAQLDFLRGAGCDEIQGYLYSRPVAPERMAELLAGGGLVA